MSDSDSDSECGFFDFRDRMIAKVVHIQKNQEIVAFRPVDETFERWSRIPIETRKQAAQRMKVCTFWLPILLQREEPSHAACWALQIGLIDPNSGDLSLKHLRKIETLEAILRALERGTVKKDQTKHVFWISNMFNLRSPEVLEDALHWLEGTGEPDIRRRVMDLGHKQTCFTALHLIFSEFAKYIQDMGTNLEKTMMELMAKPPEDHVERCEKMKKRGNDNFQKKQFDDAVKYYSKAIRYYPDNHIIYGNRALCYIRCRKYLKAVNDGKRAMLIKPLWAKGHYRYCEALFSMGEVHMAIEANVSARSLCQDDQDGLKDLEQQHQKFISDFQEFKAEQAKKALSKRPDSANRAAAAESVKQSVKAVHKIDSGTNTSPQNKVPQNKVDKKPGNNEKSVPAERSMKDSKPSQSEFSSKNGKESNNAAKKKPKNKNQSKDENKKVDDNKAAVCKELRSAVQDGCNALADLRSRNAEQAFSQALALLETSTPKDLGLSSLDVLLLLYGRAAALTEIGQPEELGEAQRLLEKMKSFEERTFQCLVFYAIGKVYVRENRFAVALEQFSDSLQMVKNQITPGKLTWPLTKEIVKETQPDYLKEILQDSIELCRFPPNPDAVCRLEKNHGHLKAEIYFTDPDFKGFIQICCCQSCIVEYHMTCWKILKASSFSEKNEKDFLQDSCFTPDCLGKICSIKIFGATGLVKCKFEAAIPKPQTPKRPKVNQKCTSQKKLKSKEERRLRRKQHKQSFKEKQAMNDEILQKKEESASQIQQKAWLLYRDRVLLQISQNMELLREEKALQVSALTGSLRPWLELDSSKGNQLAGRILNWQQEQLETVDQILELLLERKNRVWARVFIQLLSSCLDINPKLSKWACQLDSAGLNAAKSFIERYSGHLEQLDLAYLLNFRPLQEVIIEKLGTRPELFSSIGLTVTEYLKQAPPQDTRLFIWTLEEHRDDFVSCHSILDEYFDMMDGHCSVLKKSDESENNSPLKSRGRKKKPREPRGDFYWSGRKVETQRDEWDQEFYEDDSLSLLDRSDPFSVPSHLREQVAEFEDQYNGNRHPTCYKNILDNNPDPTKEILYDYFAQILEEHGPLVAEDPLLVGQQENFPPEAQLKIREAGGFEPFLLESLRFIKIGRTIGLTKHAVPMQQAEHRASLDDLDDIETSPSPDFHAGHNPAPTNYLDIFSPAQTDVHPILPSPYAHGAFPPPPPLGQSASGVTLTGIDPFSHWTSGGSQHQTPYFLANDYNELDLYSSEVDDGLMDADPSSDGAASATTEESSVKKHAAAQTCEENMRSVAVNTEHHESFETCQGDINKTEKSIKDLEKQIKEKATGGDKVDLRRKEELALIEAEEQEINTNIQVTNKELALFQQKLEEEVKKDQKEKKANQEALRTLKTEIEELVEEQGRLTQNIREKKASYSAKLTDFLELSNQSAAEKMSLEDEIRRCKDSFTSATRRCQVAQSLMMESTRDQGLHGLYRELTNAKALLSKLDEAAHRYSDRDMEVPRSSCRAGVKEVEKKIATAERQYQEQMDQVKKGRRVSELVQINNSNKPEPPAATGSLAAKEFVPPSSASHSGAPPVTQPAAAQAPAAEAPINQHKPPTRTAEPPHSTVFDKAMERLATMFPDYTRSEMMKFVQELRSSSGGSLSSMALQDVVSGVTQLILDHQEKLNSAAKLNVTGRGSPAQSAAAPFSLLVPAPVWQTPGPQRATHALNVEDPCIICHDDMSPDDICVLECRHSFHKECIRSWLKEKSTCPTCRDHALLPEEFPALSGRRRQAP